MPKPVAVGSRSEQDGASENGEAHSTNNLLPKLRQAGQRLVAGETKGTKSENSPPKHT